MPHPAIGSIVCVQPPADWGSRCFEMRVTSETNEHGLITTRGMEDGEFISGPAFARSSYAERGTAAPDRTTWHEPHGDPGRPCLRNTNCRRTYDHPGYCYRRAES